VPLGQLRIEQCVSKKCDLPVLQAGLESQIYDIGERLMTLVTLTPWDSEEEKETHRQLISEAVTQVTIIQRIPDRKRVPDQT